MDNYGYAQTGAVNKAWAPSGVSSAGIATVPRDAERVLALDSIAQNVASGNGNLSDCIVALRDIADSVFGPNPTGKDEGANSPPHMGRIDGLSQSVQGTHDLIRALRSQIERFRNL